MIDKPQGPFRFFAGTQCVWNGSEPGRLMLAIAAIPLSVGGFTGCICSVFYGGREYRLASYRGARIEAWSSSGVVICQGKYRLEAELLHERREVLAQLSLSYGHSVVRDKKEAGT